MRKMFGLAVLSLVALSGCSVKSEWAISRADQDAGTVGLSYNRNEFHNPAMSADQAKQMASTQCKKWGYQGAEVAGTEDTECLTRRGFGQCGERQITVPYKCVGAPAH